MRKRLNTLEFFKMAVKVRRPHGSKLEARFVADVTKLRPPDLIDGAGNLHWDMRGSRSASLFVAHTDTVARLKGCNGYFEAEGVIKSDGQDVLGADDAAGMAVLWYMMNEKVPGYYIFTRGEEVGGIGAKHLATHHWGLLSEFRRAIAFDRKGETSIITQQLGGVCASMDFAEALVELYGAEDLLFMPDETGVYTDTAEFTKYIPECTNISVGYTMAHSKEEQQNTDFLVKLAEASAKIDWESLPVGEKPEDAHEDTYIEDFEWLKIAAQEFGNLQDYKLFASRMQGFPWADRAPKQPETYYKAVGFLKAISALITSTEVDLIPRGEALLDTFLDREEIDYAH